MNREDIIQELKKRGYDVVPNDVYKNGVRLEAIIIKDNSRITPTIYTEPIFSHAESIKQAADVAEKIYLENKSVDFDIDKLTDADFIMAHVRIGLEHENEHLMALSRQTEYQGLMQYLYITSELNDETKWSVRITEQLAETAALDVDELWAAAEQNTFADSTICSMAQILVEMGMLDADDAVELPVDSFMYVISNHSRQRGASSILNKQLLQQFAAEHNCKKLVILPSSIHECILIPCDEEVDIENFDAMVQEVNSTQVAPEEVLLDRALIVNF